MCFLHEIARTVEIHIRTAQLNLRNASGEWVDGWMDGWVGGWVDGWVGGWVEWSGWVGG